MLKKVLLLVLVVVISIAFLTACNTASPAASAKESSSASAGANTSTSTTSAGFTAAESTGTAATGEKVKIGVTTLDLSNPFFITFVNGCKDFADQNNVELTVNDSQNSAEEQIAAIENFISLGCKAIIVCGVDATAISDSINQAQEKGIKIVSMFDLPNADLQMKSDNYKLGNTLGVAAGQWIKDNWGTYETIEAAVFNYDQLAEVIKRKEGIIEGVQQYAPNVEFVADVTANEPQVGLSATEILLEAHPNLRVVLGINDAGVLGAYEAFMAKGFDSDQYLLGGIDATPEGISKIKEGGIFRLTVDQQPFTLGSKSVDAALKLINGEEPGEVAPDYNAVTIDNVDEVK